MAVWDVRGMSKPIKVFQAGGSSSDFISGRGWLSDDPWEWLKDNKAPGWCVRNVKFNGGNGAWLGKKIMAFTEVSFFSSAFVYLYEIRNAFIAYVIHSYC